MFKRKRKWILRSLQLLVGLILMLSVVPAGAHHSGGYQHHLYADSWDYSNPDWMAKIPDYRRLSELSIPETHDTMAQTGTGTIYGAYCETQALDLQTQLESGIRSIDIRLQRDGEFLKCYHGSCDMGYVFDNVLDGVVAFLESYPSETILMRIAENNCNWWVPFQFDCAIERSPPFIDMVDDYLQRTYYDQNSKPIGPYLDWVWQPTNVNPTLGEVRGKIVILEHFSINNKPVVVDIEGRPKWTSLAVDSLGNPHISYYDEYRKQLWYASWAGDNWDKSLIDGYNDMGRYSSLALDKDDDDRPYISYYDATERKLRIAYYVGNSSGDCVNPNWSCYAIDGGHGIDVGLYTSLALDEDGNPHISYHDETNGDLKYAFWTGDDWWLAPIDGGDLNHVGESTSIALYDNDHPHISYYHKTNDELRYAFLSADPNDPGWKYQKVYKLFEGMTSDTSLALDVDGKPHISFTQERPFQNQVYGQGRTLYTYWDGTVWKLDHVSEWRGGYMGHSSLALDEGGSPHISYYDPDQEDLIYASSQGHDSSGSIIWAHDTVDSEGDVGRYSSLALDKAGSPHISYYDETNGDLMYSGPSDICGAGVPVITDFGLKDGPPCFMEDKYWSFIDNEEIYTEKWPRVKDHLIAADAGPRDRFYLNGLSGTGGSTMPYPWFIVSGHNNSNTDAVRKQTSEDCTDGTPNNKKYSDFPCNESGDKMLYEGTNELTLNYLKANPPRLRPRRWGIIVTDFPGADLIDEIIESNFFEGVYLPNIIK